MKRWDSDPGVRRLVAEKQEGVLGRRAFLARLGGTAAGAAAASFIGDARPARAQKRIVVTMWDTEPNPATRAAVKAIVEDFHKLHKDIEIQAEGMGWSDMDRKLQAAMAAKSRRPASTRESNRTPSTVMVKRSPRVSTRRAMASSHWRNNFSNPASVVAAAAPSTHPELETNATDVPQSCASLSASWMRTSACVVPGQTPVQVV